MSSNVRYEINETTGHVMRIETLANGSEKIRKATRSDVSGMSYKDKLNFGGRVRVQTDSAKNLASAIGG